MISIRDLWGVILLIAGSLSNYEVWSHGRIATPFCQDIFVYSTFFWPFSLIYGSFVLQTGFLSAVSSRCGKYYRPLLHTIFSPRKPIALKLCTVFIYKPVFRTTKKMKFWHSQLFHPDSKWVWRLFTCEMWPWISGIIAGHGIFSFERTTFFE